jgi:hypothetical protein
MHTCPLISTSFLDGYREAIAVTSLPIAANSTARPPGSPWPFGLDVCGTGRNNPPKIPTNAKGLLGGPSEKYRLRLIRSTIEITRGHEITRGQTGRIPDKFRVRGTSCSRLFTSTISTRIMHRYDARSVIVAPTLTAPS